MLLGSLLRPCVLRSRVACSVPRVLLRAAVRGRLLRPGLLRQCPRLRLRLGDDRPRRYPVGSVSVFTAAHARSAPARAAP